MKKVGLVSSPAFMILGTVSLWIRETRREYVVQKTFRYGVVYIYLKENKSLWSYKSFFGTPFFLWCPAKGEIAEITQLWTSLPKFLQIGVIYSNRRMDFGKYSEFSSRDKS